MEIRFSIYCSKFIHRDWSIGVFACLNFMTIDDLSTCIGFNLYCDASAWVDDNYKLVNGNYVAIWE